MPEQPTARARIERAFHVSFKLPAQATELLDAYRDQVLSEAAAIVLASPTGHRQSLERAAQRLITRNGQQIEAGYAVTAQCDQPNCTTQTDRGLDSLCGEQPGGDEYGCGQYFCDRHLYIAPDGESGYRCPGCNARTEAAEPPPTDDTDTPHC